MPEPLENEQSSEMGLTDSNSLFYSQLGEDTVCLRIGQNLIPLVDPDSANRILGLMADLRRDLTGELGFIIPPVRIMDSVELAENEYAIYIRGTLIAKGEAFFNHYTVSNFNLSHPQISVEGNYCLPWEDMSCYQQARAIDSSVFIVEHLKECLIANVHQVMTHMDALKFLQVIKYQDAILAKTLVPNLLSACDLQRVLSNLIQERVSVRDIYFIFERLACFARDTRNPDALSELLRYAMRLKICQSLSPHQSEVMVIALNPEVEAFLGKHRTQGSHGVQFHLTPNQRDALIQDLMASYFRIWLDKQKERPVLLCDPENRLALFRLLAPHFPKVAVLSHQEIPPPLPIAVIDELRGKNLLSE